MFSLISICYERYGSQEYEDFESLENLVLKVQNELLEMYEDGVKLEFKTGKNHIIIKDNNMMEYIITGSNDQNKIQLLLFNDTHSYTVFSFETGNSYFLYRNRTI
jgi:hypothetical protein